MIQEIYDSGMIKDVKVMKNNPTPAEEDDGQP
jgi:hypothetical protein